MKGVKNYLRDFMVKISLLGAGKTDKLWKIAYGHFLAGNKRHDGQGHVVVEQQKMGLSEIRFYGIFDQEVKIDRAKIFLPVRVGEVLDGQDLKKKAREMIERAYDMAVSTQQAQVGEQSAQLREESAQLGELSARDAIQMFKTRTPRVIQKIKNLSKPRKQAPERGQTMGNFAIALVLSCGWLMVAECGEYISVVSTAGKAIKKSDSFMKDLAGKISEITNRIRDQTFNFRAGKTSEVTNRTRDRTSKRRPGLNIVSRELDFETTSIVLASYGSRQEIQNLRDLELIDSMVDATFQAEYLSKRAFIKNTEFPNLCMVISVKVDVQATDHEA